ncbi:MAG: hypothetical protein JSS11_16840 [Verrucomicrobia bacterium]|nr:hypothetical protein [Verrucomicrobiota bacterium]
MNNVTDEAALNSFTAQVGAIVARFFRQNGQNVPDTALTAGFAARLWQLIGERGLPPSLAWGEQGEAVEMEAEVAGPLVARVLGGLPEDGLWATAARQLVKACFQPEFKKCRDSYREVEADGTCRRQQLKKALGRVSGSHCVDCPYWQGLTPEQHGKLLAKAWVGDVGELERHREVFLPEDFRALRRWVRERAR